MQIVKCELLNEFQKEELFNLWNNEYPCQYKYADLVSFNRFLKKFENIEHILLENENGHIKGWCFRVLRKYSEWSVFILAKDIKEKQCAIAQLNKFISSEWGLKDWVVDCDLCEKEIGEGENKFGMHFRILYKN